MLVSKGGIAPPIRIRSRLSLSLQDREEISRGLVAGLSLRARLLNILGDRPQRSAVKSAGIMDDGSTERPMPMSMLGDRRRVQSLVFWPPIDFLQMVVAEKLDDHWSPQQISGWLKVEYLNDRAMRVSHETIYKSLFIQARGVLKKELISHLRSKRVMRRGKTSTMQGQPRGQIVDAVSIRERPAEVEDRAIPGHWEGDLLSGGKNTHIATLVERQSRFVLLVHVEGKVATAL